MKITFVSNYINHHQIPFCNAMCAQEGVEFAFIQTEKMEEERIKMGWNPNGSDLDYVYYAYENPAECQKLVRESDMVIWGGAEDETMLKPRLEAGKPVIRYSERLYKNGQWKAVSPRGLIKKYNDHTKYRKKEVYLLCAGAYVSSDFHIVRAYPGKMLKWGYFPETKIYDIDELMAGKCGAPAKDADNGEKKVEILWAARFIDWKHPELVVTLAEELLAKETASENKDKKFHITMIGGGELEPQIRALIEEKKLGDVITLAGFKTPREVRACMECADIYLVTSDRGEGWGAVVNEAMNSGCAVVSNHMIGAAPYLIRQGENGFMYRDKNGTEFAETVELLIRDASLRQQIGRNAYQTITKEWNAEEAAKRLTEIIKDILGGTFDIRKWQSGPGSKATVLKESNRIPKGL